MNLKEPSRYLLIFSESRLFAEGVNERMHADGFPVIPIGSKQWASLVLAYIDHLRYRAWDRP